MRTEDQIPFNQWGQYLIIPVGGKTPEAHTRVTTFSSTLDDRYGLEKWAQRMAAVGFTLRPDLLAGVAACRADDKAAIDKLCAQAKEAAAASAKANLGTALHGMCERVDLGEEFHIPAPWDADVAAYRATLEAAGIEIVPGMVERYVVVPQYKLGGKLDRIVSFGSKPMICDLKTGASLDYSWGTIAVQLACYANAETLYDGKAQKHSPMPDVDKETALVVHLPAGRARCTLHFVDIKAGWDAAQRAAWVRLWRKRKDLSEPWSPGTRLDALVERRTGLAARIEALKSHDLAAVKALAASWPPGLPTLKQATDHTIDQLNIIDELISEFEDRHQAPFGPLDANGKATK